MGAQISRSSGSGWFDRAVAYVCALAAVVVCVLAPSPAQAQVQTFFVNVPAASEQRDAMELCRDRFTAALVRVGGFRANQDAITQQSVTDCLGETASATAKRECEVSMANIEVDFLIQLVVRRLGSEWNWGIKALSPAQGAAQVWGGDGSSAEADAAKAAYAACDGLAKEFACSQGVSSACVGSGFGTGPILGATPSGPSNDRTSPAAPRRVNVSALDVFDVTPTEVAIWVDGKEAGTSANQVTGIPPGEHEVTLKATGYFDQTQRLSFEAGKPAVLQGVRLRKTTASLIVTMGEPAEATVLVGGRERGRSGASLAGIAPGSTEVVVRAPGYREHREQVAFVADQEARLERVALEPLPATLTVTANVMGASILVDGQAAGSTTGEEDAFEVSYRAKRLEVLLDGYRPFSQSLALRPGGQAQVVVTLERTAAPPAPKPVVAPAAKSIPTTGANQAPRAPAGFVFVPPGSFVMGSPDREEGRQEDEWRHLTEITRGFLIQSTEVTQRQYRDIMQTNPAGFGGCGDDCPVENVSWSDAVAYANALSLQEGFPACYLDGRLVGLACPGYRLPTEAEWEYAARAGASGASYTGLDAAAWYADNANDQPSRVAQKQPNAGGIYDMLGNVWEWTGDWYTSIPNNSADPTGAVAGNGKVARGGSWRSDPLRVRLAIRDIYSPDSKNTALGFRVVRTIP